MGQVRMSELVLNQLNIDTYGQFWTYLDNVSDSIKDSLREGFEEA